MIKAKFSNPFHNPLQGLIGENGEEKKEIVRTLPYLTSNRQLEGASLRSVFH